MRKKMLWSAVVVLAGIGISLPLVVDSANAEPSFSPASIVGTYKFVSRDLPDGSKVENPEVIGLLTFTEKYRNFNIYWKGENGKPFSISYIAKYKLTDTTYEETCVYRLVNDEAGGKGVSYNLTGESGSAPVTTSGGQIAFTLPLFDEPSIVFEGNKFVATRAGEFVDHWKKVQ